MSTPFETSKPVESPQETAVFRANLLRWLLVSLFLLFFQAYMIAPLIPYLAAKFDVTRETIGMLVPAYLLPYAFATFAYGPLADRYGRRGVLLFCLSAFVVCCALTVTAQSAHQLLVWRIITGTSAGGIAVMALTLVGDLFPFAERGKALGWIFGAIAGGQAFGSTLGGILTPFLGWKGLFLMVALLGIVPIAGLLPLWNQIPAPSAAGRISPREIKAGYADLLGERRGQRTFAYILLNGFFHSGVFTWLGVYLADRYGLSETGIGLALLGYGIPGFLGGPLIGKFVDKVGRGKILPWGLALAAVSGLLLILPLPLLAAVALMTLLSLGLDMSHPLLAGIVTTLSPERRAQAMGLNTFTLFLGLALGSLAFGWGMQHFGFVAAMTVFGIVQGLLALASVWVFRHETPHVAHG